MANLRRKIEKYGSRWAQKATGNLYFARFRLAGKPSPLGECAPTRGRMRGRPLQPHEAVPASGGVLSARAESTQRHAQGDGPGWSAGPKVGRAP